MSDLQIRRLEAENETLRDRVAVLEDLLFSRSLVGALPQEWRLTPCEDKLFRALLRLPIASADYLTTASAKDYAMDDPPTIDCVRTRIHTMRRKLAPFGVAIRNHHGRGYSLDEAVRLRLKGADVNARSAA